jgi:N-succinyldiaminopimelate aminotransferase
MVNNRISQFDLYPFQRLSAMLDTIEPPSGLDEINMAMGEPQHAAPDFIAPILMESMPLLGKYPPMIGTPSFRAAAGGWLERRYRLPAGMIEPDQHIMPVFGTREALFMAGLTAIPEQKRGRKPVVLIPDPFYQIYLGAAVFGGAEPVFLPTTRETGFLPDFRGVDKEILERTVLAYLCTPANPHGAAADLDYLRDLIELAREHDFIVAFDECYTELYYGAPTPGSLEACAAMGGGMDNVLSFNSLSKRSSVPGLRSGFVAGHADLIDAFWRVRLYGGASSPLPTLAVAEALWNDDDHVEANRTLYREKFDAAERILGNRYGFYRPDGGFYLWLDVGDGEEAARTLWAKAAIKVQPGTYFAHTYADGTDVGKQYIRVALVHDLETVTTALQRIGDVL